MQLTQLEVKGFKSFGDKITINFDEGITSIVGPNGCGKSNVVDAIRWVLGEQSTKTLRSEKMENIIFNGTNTRKQAQLAEVSLSFNNNKNILPTEFSQVTITRKLYRNGDSEYRLNDVQCRLKDITDLFMDTGIGSDSYAIIELKMVEEIISNKEHSRRNLFEEASGISKYKTRKKQTINRLTDTENDLSRVEDLLYEIEKNLKSLENQARKTERYYALKEQYKVWSLTLTSLRIAETQRSLKAIQVQHLDEEHQNTSLNAAIAQAEFSIQQLKEESLIKEQHVALQQKKLNQQLSEIRGFEMEKTIKNEQLNNFQKREGQLNQEIVHDKQQIKQVQNQLKRLQEDSLEARSLLSGMEAVLATQLQEIAVLKHEQVQEKEQLDALRNTKNERQKKSYELEKQITILTIQGDALREESRRSRSDEQNKAEELAGFNERLEGIFEQTEALEDRLFSAQENEQANLHAITEMEKALEQVNEKSQQNARLLDAKKNEFNLTKSMVDNLEGFPESIRFLKKSPQWNKNIPLFSDILLCQEKYRAAVENLLEPYMNYYVVESFHEAYEAINLLSDARKGKAGFFVLENLPAALENTTAPAHLIPALSVIEVEKKYALLCSHLLHSVYIQTHSQADGLPGGNLVLLEPSGKYFRKNFSLSGGAVGLFDGKKIGRTRNLDQLANEIKKLTTVQQEIESEKDRTIHAFSQLKRHTQKALIEELQGQINRLKNDHISIQTRREQNEVFIQNNLEQKNTIEAKITNFEQALKQANPELLLLQQERTLAEEALLKKQEDFTLLAEELSEKNTEYNQTNIQFHQQNNKVLGIEKDIEYREIQVEDNEKQVAQKEKEYQEIQQGMQEILQHVDLSQADLLALYAEKEALENALQEVEQDYFAARGTTTTLEQEVQRLRKNKEISDTLIQEYKDQINRYHLELNAIKERLSVEFSFDMDELQDPQEIDENENELSERIKKTKKQLDDFGAINPMAMQAYQEMNDRYRFIIEEKNDLIDARVTLLKTIQEIDLNAKEKFMEAFLKVRENFKMVFRSLFNDGDTCDLIISDPENPLESNIEIIARPKGKRPLSINQLSGGEKTLTSTALLFSLYLLKPAPFCIFDEIDAPLDDTNIDKFNNIIREFSNNSQFIIVSHNKRTIASTDIIYGVTMVEAGISRVVPVDMRASFGSIVDVN